MLCTTSNFIICTNKKVFNSIFPLKSASMSNKFDFASFFSYDTFYDTFYNLHMSLNTRKGRAEVIVQYRFRQLLNGHHLISCLTYCSFKNWRNRSLLNEFWRRHISCKLIILSAKMDKMQLFLKFKRREIEQRDFYDCYKVDLFDVIL